MGRRWWLKVLGFLRLAGGGRKLAFCFDCACGESCVALVPKWIGDKVEFGCSCGTGYSMEWMGDRFKVERFGGASVNMDDGLKGSLAEMFMHQEELALAQFADLIESRRDKTVH